MRNVTLIVDQVTGELTIEGLDREEAHALPADLLPAPAPVNCAQPLAPPADADRLVPGAPALRLHRIYHSSVVDGPGRRSVLQVQGCGMACPGCYARATWDPAGGVAWGVPAIVDALLDPAGRPRDGYTVLGGEPFEQPAGVAAILEGILEREPGAHITVYSGHYLETLLQRPEPSVRRILELASLLIDGPFVASLSHGAGEWRGSTNQRLLALAPTALPAGWRAEGAFPTSPIRHPGNGPVTTR